MTIQLSDLLETSINLYDPSFQAAITGDEQYGSLGRDLTRTVNRGDVFPHQEFVRRYLRNYPSLFIMDEPGTGKTCSVTRFTEYAREQHMLATTDPFGADYKVAHLRKTYVLVKGKTQVNEFRYQLVCRCTRYYEEQLVNIKSNTDQKTKITNAIKEYYKVSGYRKFINSVLKKYPNFLTDMEQQESALREFDDSIFWIDEAHNLILLDETINDKDAHTKDVVYAIIKIILQGARRSKTIITTATPAINATADFTSMCNLVLPPDGIIPEDYDLSTVSDISLAVHFPQLARQYLPTLNDPVALHDALLPLREMSREELNPYFVGQIPLDTNYETITMDELNAYLQGRITYVRTLDNAVTPQFMTNSGYDGPIPPLDTKLFYIWMSPFQTAHYNMAYEQSKTSNDGVYNSSRQASDFVFPDGTWGNNINDRGKIVEEAPAVLTDIEQQEANLRVVPSAKSAKEGTNKYIIRSKKGSKFTITNEFRRLIPDLDSIYQYSAKYYAICYNIENIPGSHFVYGDYVTGSGTVVLAALLELLGYQRFSEQTSIFSDEDRFNPQEYTPFCPPDDTIKRKQRRVRNNFIKRPRYALITGKDDEKNFPLIMEAMNSYANRHGEYIKVLITSRIGRDGINVYNVRAIHIIGAAWNYAAIYQSLFRGLRATSHYDLIEELTPDDEGVLPDLLVQIFLYAAVASNYLERNQSQSDRWINERPDIESIDVKMYQVAEAKDKKIRMVMRMLKELAVTCQIFHERNVRNPQYNNTSDCDYQLCDYPCFDDNPLEIDYHNYDLKYSDQDIESTITIIVPYLSVVPAITYSQLKDLTASHLPRNGRYLLAALERIIDERREIIDRRGFSRFLHYHGDTYYLSDEYYSGTSGNVALSWYSYNLLINDDISFEELTHLRAEHDLKIDYNELGRNMYSPEVFRNYINGFNIDIQVSLLEEAITAVIKGMTGNRLYNMILANYESYVYPLHEPMEMLTEEAARLSHIQLAHGEQGLTDEFRVRRYTNSELDKIVFDESAPIVYVHNLYGLTPTPANYASNSRYSKGEGRLRILVPREAVYHLGWRDVLVYEYQVYNMLIQRAIRDKSQFYRKTFTDLFGIVQNGVFKIVDLANQQKEAATSARHVKTGRQCNFYGLAELYGFMWRAQVPLGLRYYDRVTDADRSKLIAKLSIVINIPADMPTWPLERLAYYADAIESNFSISSMCSMIRSRLSAIGAIQQN